MDTHPDSASPSAPAPEVDLLRSGRSPPVSAVSLAWAIPLAGLVPWRAFPALLRMSIGPLVAVYLATVAASLALTFHGLSKAGWPTGSWQGVLLGQVVSMPVEFLGLYVLLTLSGASRRQRLPETLTAGLKLAMAGWASMFLYMATIFVTMRMAGFPPGSIGIAACVVVWTGVEIYMIAAMSLTAAWLAEQEDRAEPSDPLWPRCIQCDYSLRGLPAAEEWLNRQQGEASTSSMAEDGPSACPECGSTIAESLREWDAWLARGRRQPDGQAKRAASDPLDANIFTPWFERLMRWMVDERRMTGVALWLVSAAFLAVATVVLLHVTTGDPPSAIVYRSLYLWKKVLLWTGVPGLLVGLRFSLRGRQNVLWLSQPALAPATCLAGVILVILLAKHINPRGPLVRSLLPDPEYTIWLPFAVVVLIAEWLVLWRAARTWSADRGR